MKSTSFREASYDSSSALSIYEYSRFLIGNSLRSLLKEDFPSKSRAGKGGLGQMVEELFFGYSVNSSREADFTTAGVELKCTPLLSSKNQEDYRIKERLVCTMIDYFEIVNTKFDDSHLYSKCRLMLLLFYLHVKGQDIGDYEFLFRVLWKIPEKDLLIIARDYERIAEKVKRGEAHLLSEGDTLYLGACRKGQKGDKPQEQPYSDIPANRRAFSLKPSYVRQILRIVKESGKNHYSNYAEATVPEFELADAESMAKSGLEDILLRRFNAYLGLDYLQICDRLGIEPYQSKSKYADVCGLIASEGIGKRLSKAEEFIKSGISVKTVRLRSNGMPKECISFKNIDYQEVFENERWIDSELYEIFTGRFMFVVFRPVPGRKINIYNRKRGLYVEEDAYVLDKVFFWTMPASDLKHARVYWEQIRENVMANRIRLDAFWAISDGKKFHVRPKAALKTSKAENPHGGECDKYCYWFNADYVKEIIDSSGNEH